MKLNKNIQSAPSVQDAAQVNANLSTSGTDTQLNADLVLNSNHHSDEKMTDLSHPVDHTNGTYENIDSVVSTVKTDLSVSILAKNLALQIQGCIDTQEEPIELLQQLNTLLFHQYPLIITEIMSVQLQDRQDFYKTVFKTTADKLLQTQNLVHVNYLPQILKFFRNILVNFFPEDIESECLTDIVHSLFNLDAQLYTLALQNSFIKKLNQVDIDVTSHEDEDLTLEQRRLKREYEWRLSLQPGSRVDAVLQIHISNQRIGQWCKGTVIQTADNNNLLVTFDNVSAKHNKIISRFGNEIAIPDTFTDDIDWKFDLKENDLVDGLDVEHVWYRSTILGTRTIVDDSPAYDENQQPKQIKQVYVGYRIYDEEEGHKWDDEGKKFLGWSNKYDIWTSVTEPLIQKHRSLIKYYKMVGKQYQLYDMVVEDISDVIQNTKERKVWTVFRNNFFSNLRCIPDYFNEFGQRGGFEKILYFLRNKNVTKSLRHLYLIVDFLSKSQPLWHRQFACYYIPEIRHAFEQALLCTNSEGTGPIQQKFSKESLSGLQRAFQSILRRHYTQDVYHQIMAELNFNIGFSLLKSEKLEQRIQGIKEVIEQIKGTKFSMRKTLSAKEVMAKLKQENIFETVFGENYHIQLIQRALEIIKFYIHEKEITEKEIDQIWQATKKDQQTKMEIYKIIQECAIMFKNDEIEMLVARFAEVPPDQFVEKEIECVYELSKYSYKLVTFSVRAAQLFWDIAVQERAYKKQIIELAMDKFLDLIRNWDREQKYNFINKCIHKIRNNESSVQCIKIIQKILEQIPNYKVNNQATLYDIATNLIKEDDLINLVIFDMILYNDQINELWNKKILTEQNIESSEVLNLPFTHRSQSYIRLNFIRQMLQNSQQKLEQTQLDQIWDLLMVRSKVSIDSDIFFDWFKTLLSDQNKLSPELILNFFQSKVCKEDVNFKFIKKSGFDCIKNIFLKINEQEDKIQVILNPGMGNNNLSVKLEIKVHDAPNNLIGIDVIWKLLAECDKRNTDLTALVIELITKVYHSLSPNLEAQKHIIEDQFCRETIGRIINVVDNAELSEDDRRNFVKSATTMLKSFFQDAEKNGTGDMKPHMALQKGLYIENLIIQNTITNNKACPKYIVLNVYSNITVWQLKKLVAKKLNQSPLRITLNRIDSKKKQITDLENLTLLKDFRFDQYEMVNAQKKPNISLPRVMLLTKKKELVPEARQIFESWFEKFSVDGYMTPDTCVEFIRNSTQDQTVAISDPRVVRLFNEYDKDIDAKITKEEFLEFYKDRSMQKPDLVWSNLHQHGYGNDLKPQTNLLLTDDPNEVKDPSSLPRYKLSEDQQIFNDLFKLFDKLSTLGQDDLWTFIQQLRTNPYIYAKLLSLSGLSDVVEETSVHKLLYNFQILESLINEYQDLNKQEVKCYYFESQEYNQNFPTINSQSNQNSSNIETQQDIENQRDQQNTAPVSGAAIPLPSGPALVNQGGGIPDAPPMHGLGVPFVGPVLPPVGGAVVGINNQKNKETLENFKGQIISEPYSDQIIPDYEIAKYLGVNTTEEVQDMRQSFIQTFVSNDGFKVLQQILLKIVGMAQQKSEVDVFNNRAQRDCLNSVIKYMKILLMSSFMGNTQSAELTLEMTRKMSQKQEDIVTGDYSDVVDLEKILFNESNTTAPIVNQNQSSNTSDTKKAEIKKSQIQSEQEDLEKMFKPLINILLGDLGQRIIDSIDFKEFSNQILSIILMILKKKDKLVADDMSNIQTAFYLWISVILYNQDMLQGIMDDHYRANQQGTQSIIEVILDQGLLCNNYTIRNGMLEGLKFLFLNIKMQTLSEAPYLFILSVVSRNVQLTVPKSKESKQFFMLLKVLLEKYFDSKNKQTLDFKQIFDTKELLHEFFVRLQTYESKERKTSFIEDTNLVGYIQIIDEIIKNEPTVLNIDETRNFIQYLIEKCLFTFDLQPISQHIGKDTKLEDHEKPQLNKCLSVDSRFACLNLLKRLCETQVQLIPELIQNYFYPLVNKVQRPKRPHYAPRTEGRSFYGFCGIRNLGCICYMNSMIQQFFHIPAFRYCLMATQDNQAPNLQPFEGRQVDDNMLHQLMKFMGFLELSERQDYDPRDFCFSFKDFAGQPTNVRVQQDTQEFLNLAFDRIERLLENTTQKYLLNNIFQGATCSLMICKNCGNLRQNRDSFYNLSLEVKNQKTIHDALKKFVTGEIINDFKCEACNTRTDVERRTVIDRLPNMLMVHLQRIIFDFDSFQNVKLNSRLEFPNVLNLKPYMLSEIMKQEKDLLKKAQKDAKKLEKQKQRDAMQQEQEALLKAKQEEGKDEEAINMDQMEIKSSPSLQNNDEVSSDDENEEMDIGDYMQQADEDFEYKLVGVVVHMGTAQAGHYISYININRGHKSEEVPEWLLTEKERWLEFNDSAVKDFKFSNLEDDCFGGVAQGGNMGNMADMKSDYTKNAYMLIYEKRRKEEMKIVIPSDLLNNQQSQQTLGCDGTAIARDQPANEHFLNVLPQLQELIAQGKGIHFDEQKQEHFALVQFNSAQKFVPQEIYQHVHEDNVCFLREKQILNNNFFETMKYLLETSMEKTPEIYQNQSPYNQMLQDFIQRMIFEFLPFTAENKCIKDLNQVMLKALSLNESQLINFIDTRILVDKSKLEKDERTFIENMIQKMDTDTREANKNILIFVVNKLFELERYDKIDEIMQPIFGMIPEDFSKNWLKIGQVLSFLFEVTKSGYPQICYMVKNGIISKLIDLIMENESPKAIGKNRQAMGSNYAQPQLENAILLISWICRHYQKITMINENPENDSYLQNFNYISYFFLPSYQQDLPPLSEDDLFMLSQKGFYVRNLKAGYEKLEFGRLIAHLQFCNYEFSRRISKKILLGLNKASSDEVEPYLIALSLVLVLNDPFKLQRFEWLLGIPQLKIEKHTIYNNNQSSTTRKIGVSAIDNANDDVYEYRSTLFKQSSTIKESFLQILYQFRKRWAKYLYQGLLCLFQSCQQDPTGMLLHYLKTMEPPSYIYGRYIDWIQPYIQDQIEQNSRSQQAKSELFMAIQVQTMLDILLKPQPAQQPQVQQQDQVINQQDQQQEVSSSTVQDSETIQIDTSTSSPSKSVQQQDQQPQVKSNKQEEKYKVYNYSSQDGGPDQYLMWNIVEEKIVEERVIEEDQIQLTIKELTVRITESKPDGRYNKIFPPNQFTYSNKYGNNNNSNQGYFDQNNGGSNKKNKQRQYGRGQPIGNGQLRGRQQTNQGAQYATVQKQGNHTVMVAQNRRNGVNLGSGNYKKKKKGQMTIVSSGFANNDRDNEPYNNNAQQQDDDYYQHQHSDSANNQDADAMGNVASQDNSMEVEYNEDNIQDQQEYFAEEGVNHYDVTGGNRNQNNRYNNAGSTTPQDEYIDTTQQQQQYIDPQEINILNDIDNDQQDYPQPNDQTGVVPVVTSVRNQPRRSDNDEEAMEQDYDNDNVNRNNYQQVINQDIDQEGAAANQPQNNDFVGDEQENNDVYGEPDVWEAAQACVLVFTVQNLDMMHSKNVIIMFKDNTQPSEGQQPLNFRIPRTVVPSLIMSGKERDILTLTKLRPFDSWGNYEYQVKVAQPKQRGGDREMQSRTNLNLAKVGIATNEQSLGYDTGATNIGGPIIQDSNMGVGVGVGVGANDMYTDLMDAEMANQKACPFCTFLNSSYLTQCEMCGSIL